MSQYDVGFPGAPCTDPDGEITSAWRRFFTVLWSRTGQAGVPAIGLDLPYLLGLGQRPPVAVTPGASPYAYTAPSNGTLYVANGGVGAMTITRGTAAACPVGAFYGAKRLMAGDVLTITYTTAPTLNFLPG